MNDDCTGRSCPRTRHAGTSSKPRAMTKKRRLTRALRRLLSRQPAPQELELLQQTLAHYRQRFESAPDDAAKLIATGEFPVDSSPTRKRLPLDRSLLAADQPRQAITRE